MNSFVVSLSNHERIQSLILRQAQDERLNPYYTEL